MGYEAFTCHTIIDAPISAALVPACQRKLWIDRDRIVYLLFSPQGTLIQCRLYENTSLVGDDVFMRLVLEKEALFETPFMGCEVFWGGEAAVLMPAELHDNLQELRMMRIHVNADMGPEGLRRQAIEQHNAMLVFDIPEVITHMLEHYVRYYVLHHIWEPLIRSSDHLAQTVHSHLLMLVGQKEVSIVAQAKGQLQFCQRFPALARTDMLYYLQSVRKVTGLAATAPVFAVGQLGTPFPEQEALHSYLPTLAVPTLPLALPPDQAADIPHWQFSFLGQ